MSILRTKIKDIYLYNYLKTHKSTLKISKYTRPIYAIEFMCIKASLITTYPIFRFLKLFFNTDNLREYLLIYLIAFGLVFYILNMIFIENNLDQIIKAFDKKTINEIANIRLRSMIFKTIILLLNIFLFFN